MATKTKLAIGSLEDTSIQVTAQYNPKDLPLTKSVPWNPTGMSVQYGGQQGRELTVELFFDGYEDNKSVNDALDILDKLSSPQDPSSKREAELRPHRCVVSWGSTFKSFPCVIRQVDTKYVMWNNDGMPVRATATVRLLEIDLKAMAIAEGKRERQLAQPGMRRVS